MASTRSAIQSSELPLLKPFNHRITSDATPSYNCIAWAADDQSAWWWPDPNDNYFWPEGIPRQITLECFRLAYQTIGYSDCEDNGIEKGYEKIAIFAKNGAPTHAARQLKNGRWTSKLGVSEDIEHELGAVEGPLYGNVVLYMRRKKSEQ